MKFLVNLHNRVFDGISTILAPWFLSTTARFFFASILLLFFWNSGKTKIGESLFSPSVGAYAQIFPKKLEAVSYDTSQLPALDTLIVLAGTYAEFVLPALVVLGLFTRLASLGMIGFIAVMSYVDVYGHNADEATVGQMFDRLPYGLILDQRLLWVFLLFVLMLKGAGPLSVDAILRKFVK